MGLTGHWPHAINYLTLTCLSDNIVCVCVCAFCFQSRCRCILCEVNGELIRTNATNGGANISFWPQRISPVFIRISSNCENTFSLCLADSVDKPTLQFRSLSDNNGPLLRLTWWCVPVKAALAFSLSVRSSRLVLFFFIHLFFLLVLISIWQWIYRCF